MFPLSSPPSFWSRKTIKGWKPAFEGNRRKAAVESVCIWAGSRFFFFISGTSHLITFELQAQAGKERLHPGTMAARLSALPAWPCLFRLILDARAQRRSLKIGENESVRFIFLLFLEGEFIFHVLKGACDRVPTESLLPWIQISICVSNKAHIWGSVSHWFISAHPNDPFAFQTCCPGKKCCECS